LKEDSHKDENEEDIDWLALPVKKESPKIVPPVKKESPKKPPPQEIL
jgi:hypothetical protein